MSVGSGEFANILKGDEVERFLKSFILPDDVRASAEREHPNTKFPKDVKDVIGDVKEIWEKKGFLSPAELRNELVQRYTPNADPKLSKLLSDVELSRNIPEKTTGYLSKEHAYSATGLAHLYAKETGRPIAMAEVDFSNMGGTNEEFKRRLAKEQNIPLNQVDSRKAEGMTDKAVRLLCDTMTKALGDSLPDGAKLIPIRTGGDEVRLIFTGVDDPAELKKITTKMHAMIEANVAGMGLQNHPHLKDPDNPVRNGFGAAIVIQDMNKIDNPHTLIQTLDEDIKIAKEEIGHTRLGTIDEPHERQKIEASIQSGKLKVPDGQTHADFVQTQVDEAARISHATSESLKATNPVHANPTQNPITAFEAHVERVTPLMGDTPIVSAMRPGFLANSNPIGENRPADVAPLAGMEERRTSLANAHLTAQNVQVSDSQKHFLGQSIHNLTSIDPSAQTTMPTSIISLTEIHAREGEEYRNIINPNDPKVREGLKRAGLNSVAEVKSNVMAVSFHNLAGLNSEVGHNNADLFLRHFSTIMDDSFKQAGFEGNGKKPYTISHHGGGNFTVLVNPAATDAKGNINFMSDAKLKEVQQHIDTGVAALNKKNVADFMRERGVNVTPEMQAEFDKKGITTTSTIPDPKARELSTDKSIKARVDGIHSVVAIAEIHPALVGPAMTQQMVHNVRQEADGAMLKLRDDKVREAHSLQSPAAPATTAAPKPQTQLNLEPAPQQTVVKTAPAVNEANFAKHDGHGRVAGSGVGVGMGAYGLSQKLGENGTAAADLNDKTTRKAAHAGIIADAAAIAVDTADGLATLQKVSKGLEATSKVSRVAAPVGIALSVASGVIDYKIADTKKDATRASNAIGGTAGGMVGAAAGGMVGAKVGAAAGAAVGVWFAGVGAVPLAAIGGVVGGVVGAIGGAFAGGEAGKKVADVTIKDSLQKKYDAEKRADATAAGVSYKSMNAPQLASILQKDANLPHKINLKGHEVTLAQAMEDKTFRAGLIKNMEAEAKKNPDLAKSLVGLKAYDERLDTAEAKTPATTKPPATAKPIVTTVADAQYKSMNAIQLASVIQKDPTLPDTVKIGKTETPLADALKDKDFRKTYINNLEKAQANGNDLGAQIAMVKAYETALSQQQTAHIEQKVAKIAAPAMA